MTSRSPILASASPPDDRHAVRRADQVEPESPEAARVGSAVAVGRVPCQVGALDSFAALAAGHRGRIEQTEVLAPRGGVAGQFGDHRRDEDAGGADAFVVSGLGGHLREHVVQVVPGVADPPGLGAELQQLLGDDQAQEFGIRERRLAPGVVFPGVSERRQYAVFQIDVKCSQEGVEFTVHNLGLTPSATD